MSTLQKMLSNLELQMNNIMADSPSEAELKAINEQTRQLTAVSKQVVDIYRLSLDAGRFAYHTGQEVRVDDDMISIGGSRSLSISDEVRRGH
ncbi:hypothetical protein [Psychrobacter sp. 16-MNA-CIBAN-0192]|uniref:hypothetical protein n=1 Tax=Psychrobacter sp. 16-MNA-CIBAN-0192 TaxID=3140448 RepID=UPI0033199F7E